MTAKGLTTSNLIDAIHAGLISGVVNALDAGADIESADMHGYPGLPLRTACFDGNLGIVRELLTRGANVNAAASDGPGAPIRLALRKGHQDIVALLLRHGAQMPEGIAPPSDTTEAMLDHADVPTRPESKPDSNIIEFSHYDTFPAADDADTASQFGTETNALRVDLLFLDENGEHHASAHPKNSQ